MNDIFLTQITLDPYDKRVRRILTDRYALHQIVYSLRGEGHDGRLLWRLEPFNGKKRPVVLAQTPFAPDLGYFLEQGLGDAQVRRIQLELKPGVYAFRLEANAVRRREQRARPLVDPDEQVRWLEEKLAPLELLSVLPVRTTILDIRKPGGDTYPLHAVLFEGKLRIAENAAVEAKAKMQKGIGRSRSMGLGMLSLKRTI